VNPVLVKAAELLVFCRKNILVNIELTLVWSDV
jgi:hypothetical protein